MSDWEIWDSDEETLEGEGEIVDEDEEIIGDSEEVIDDDEEIVAKPNGDSWESYTQGFIEEIPKISDTRRWIELVQSYRQYKSLAQEMERRGNLKQAKHYQRLVKRYGDLVFYSCPYRPSKCPLYSLTSKCPVGMEKTCRPRAWRSIKPRRLR